MSLTPEQIDMIKRLQPVFKEKMGEWQEYDEGYDLTYQDTFWIAKEGSNKGVAAATINNHGEEERFHRIPKPIDWQNPERGCLGMLHEDFKIQKYVPACKITNTYEYRIDHYYTINQKIHDYHVIDTDLFTALLKALCEQEGV